MVALRESPTATRLRLGFGLAEDHLFSGRGEQFGHTHSEAHRQSFNLSVERFRQLDFGSFHGDNLPPQSGLGQERRAASVERIRECLVERRLAVGFARTPSSNSLLLVRPKPTASRRSAWAPSTGEWARVGFLASFSFALEP